MASLDLDPDDFRSIESLRNRLFLLSNSIGSLKADIYRANPLPTPESLKNSAHILQQNVDGLQSLVAEHAGLLQRVAVHPSTNFPGRTQENILLQLLRKKLEPDIETWVEEGREVALKAGVDPTKLGSTRGSGGRGHRDNNGYDDDDDEEEGYRPEDDEEGAVPDDPLSNTWADVRDAVIDRIQEFARNESQDPYTPAERAMGVENVRTGLRRSLEEDSSDEEDDDEEEEQEDEEMPDVQILSGPPGSAQPAAAARARGGAPAAASRKPEPEIALWAIDRGDTVLPHFVEYESQQRLRDAIKRAGMAR